MKSTIYIETSIPSFYYETREAPEFIAMRNWTREWWDFHIHKFNCYTSVATLNELKFGKFPEKENKIELMEDIESLEINRSIQEIVEVYISHYLMPKNHLGDALHLAIASFYKMDFLLTWNCTHLANANKKAHIRRINERLMIFTPEIVTPLELLEDE